MKGDFLSLQNGNDVRGIALEGMEGEKVNLTSYHTTLIGLSFVTWLKEKTGKTLLNIAIGNDSRLSAYSLKKGIIDGICLTNSSILDCGLASTPAMFMSTIIDEIKADGAIMITASHLPYNRNGLKFFTKNGALEKEDVKEILTLAEEYADSEYASREIINCDTLIGKVNLMDAYSKILVEKIKLATEDEKPLLNTKIVVDAGNGSGGFFVEKVLVPLGADVTGSQFLNPDGTFPNHIPNPEDRDAMLSIKKCVLHNKADLGIIFDTDVDRAAIVDSNGEIINRNRLIALISNIVLKEYPGTTIVTDSVTSDELSLYIESIGGTHHRFKRGYKNVINESIRLNKTGEESHLAIETSGHAALKENYFLDDGAYLIVKILITMAKLRKENKSLHSLIDSLEEPISSKEIRIKIEENNFIEYGTKVLDAFKEFVTNTSGWSIAPNSYEGVRVNCSNSDESGWCLIRMSLHDPVLPINIESKLKTGSDKIFEKIQMFLSRFNKLKLNL